MSSRSAAFHPDHATEQAYVENVHGMVQLGRERAKRAPESAGDKFAARSLRKHVNELLADPVDLDALCFGRIDREDGRTHYLGRGAVHDEQSKLLVINWRLDLAKPFYTANRSEPEGLIRRRRFQLDQVRLLGIVDDAFAVGSVDVGAGKVARASDAVPVDTRPAESATEPEVSERERAPDQASQDGVAHAEVLGETEETKLTAEPEVAPAHDARPDPHVVDAILADMDRARGTEMRDIVATIEASQYDLIADSIEGVLTIQGGPGTGKTAVALHRAAWLLYNHSEELERSGVLVIGPNRAFMEYVSKVLPSLGETSVTQLSIDRLHGQADVRVRASEGINVARVKGDMRMAAVVQRAVTARVRLPEEDVPLTVGYSERTLPSQRIAEIVGDAWRSGRTYLAARDAFRRLLVGLAREQFGASDVVLASGPTSSEVEAAVAAAGGPLEPIWPTVTAADVIRDLLNSRQRLRAAADGSLSDHERAALQRDSTRSVRAEQWTAADLALLDEAEALLRGVGSSFGYVLVDEAQDLSPMQLRMVFRRSAKRRATLVGDIAQATGPTRFPDWPELLDAAGVESRPRIAELGIGYRVPRQIMELAAQLLPRIVAPEITQPTAVREGAEEPRIVAVDKAELGSVLAAEVANRLDEDRSLGVITAPGQLDALRAILTDAGIQVGDVLVDGLERPATLLTAGQAKGLEFDNVVVVEPAAIAGEDEDWAYVYIALTRATRSLSVLHTTPQPFELSPVEAGPEPSAEPVSASEPVSGPEPRPIPRVAGAPIAPLLGAPYTEGLMQAKFLHGGKCRRGSAVPALAHLQAVAALVLEDGGSQDEAIAALLHDSVEAHGAAVLDRIVEQFGIPVARIVAGCTDPDGDEGDTWRERKIAYLHGLESAGPQVRRVALAQALDNARALLRDYRRVGELLWARMDVDPEVALWYQLELADLFQTERPGDMASELNETVEGLLDVVSAPDLEA